VKELIGVMVIINSRGRSEMPFRKSDIKMEDGFAHLDESRHKQQPDVEREFDLARRCESGHLSYAEVPEDYPFDPVSAYAGFDYQFIFRPTPVREVEHAPECDLSGEETGNYWKDKIYGPWVEFELPEMGQAA
jgi:hypothetical protein